MLINKYLPNYDFSERHAIDIRATPEEIMAAIIAFRYQDDPLFHRLLALRELPARLTSRLSSAPPQPSVSIPDRFQLLEQRDAFECLYGLIGRFWRPDYGLADFADGDAFIAFSTPGVAKLVLSYSVFSLDKGARLITETRAFCPDRASYLKLWPYWWLVRPFSGLIRRRILTRIRNQCERPGPAPTAP